MSSFISLTLALKGLFDEPLSALPETLRQRVRKEFDLIPWDLLSAEDREIVALQCDYPDDPETEKERRFWWEWTGRKAALMTKIAEWEFTATPTALDLAQKETRLAELRHELASVKTEDFVAAIESDTVNQTNLTLDLTVLATPAQLLDAFGQWNLKKGWFNEPSKHPWLLVARKLRGKGGNKPIAPLYCPFEVMIGLATKIRCGKGTHPRISEEKGWQILNKYFPEAHYKFRGPEVIDDQS